MRHHTIGFIGLFLLVALAVACERHDGPLQLHVSGEVIESDVPVVVEASEVREDDHGLLTHEVVVGWRGESPVRLDDARFTHRVTANQGHLITAGRGCSADWGEDDWRPDDGVVVFCTDDLRIIEVNPAGVHEYPLRIYPELGPRRLAPGTYVVEETVRWWEPEDHGVAPYDPTYLGQFTIRLTYEVR